MNRSHDNNFNLLRFIFASLVIVAHAPEIRDGNRSEEILTRLFGTISFGEFAVDCFFVLSGYLIVKSWNDHPNFLSFATSRVLRIYPGFIAASLLCAFVVGPAFGTPTYFHEFEWRQFFGTLARLGFRGIPPVFPGTHEATLNAAVWTIPYEFKCYVLVLVFGMLGLLKIRGLWLSVLLLSMSGFIAHTLGLIYIPFDFYVRFLMVFSAGGCFFLYRDTLRWRNDLAWLAAILFLALLFVKPLAEPALCTLGAYAILHYGFAGTALLRFNRFPDVSYGVYLYAWPINKIVLWYSPDMNVYALMASVFLLAVAAGTLSWYAVEKPFMKMKRHFQQDRPPAAPVGS